MSKPCYCDESDGYLPGESHEHCLACECILGSQGDEEHLCFVCSGGSYTGRPRPEGVPIWRAVEHSDGTVELVEVKQ
jgi:hypothetical protein